MGTNFNTNNLSNIEHTKISQKQQNSDLSSYIKNNPHSIQLFNNYLSDTWKKCGIIVSTTDDITIPLPAIYIALNTQHKVIIGNDNISGQNKSDILIPPENSYLHFRITKETENLSQFYDPFIRPLTAVELLEHSKRIMLLGNPGSGKSTFLKFIALCMAGEILQKNEANLTILNMEKTHKPWPHGVLLPIFIEIRKFARSSNFPDRNIKGNANHLLDYITDSTAKR